MQAFMVLCCIDHISHSVVSSFLVVARFVDLKVVDLLLFTVKFPVVDGTDARGGAQVVAVGAPVFTHRSHSSKGDVSWSKHSAIVTDQMMVLESLQAYGPVTTEYALRLWFTARWL